MLHPWKTFRYEKAVKNEWLARCRECRDLARIRYEWYPTRDFLTAKLAYYCEPCAIELGIVRADGLLLHHDIEDVHYGGMG